MKHLQQLTAVLKNYFEPVSFDVNNAQFECFVTYQSCVYTGIYLCKNTCMCAVCRRFWGVPATTMLLLSKPVTTPTQLPSCLSRRVCIIYTALAS